MGGEGGNRGCKKGDWMGAYGQGQWGEDRVCEGVLDRGWVIVYRNYRIGGGELDIVAFESPSQVVVIEVKSGRHEGVEARVTGRQLRRLYRTMGALMAAHPSWDGWDIRLDVVAVWPTGMRWCPNVVAAGPFKDEGKEGDMPWGV